MDEMGLYVYGMMRDENINPSGQVKGIDGEHPLIAVKEGNTFAAASEVNLNVFGEGKLDVYLEDMAWVEEKARRHFEIQQYLFSSGVFIPVRFCTIYNDVNHLRDFLSDRSCRFEDAFSFFADKEEWTLKVYCERKKLLERKMLEEKERMRNQQNNTSKGASYFMLKKLESTLDDKVRDDLAKIRENLWKRLNCLAEEALINKNLSRQVTERIEDMILNASLLMRKDMFGVLETEVRALEEAFKTSDIHMELTGPWPVYNFSASKIS